MTDPATKSHPQVLNLQPPLLIEWRKFPAFGDVSRKARVDYVKQELQRAEAAGISPLFVAVTLPLALQQQDAFDALKAMGHSTVNLRLVDGCYPPVNDSQGRPLSEELQGKALVTKVANLVMDAGERQVASRRGADIYEQVTITSEPVAIGLDEAIAVLRQWGYGVRAKRAQRPNEGPRRDEWLVVHVKRNGQPYSAETQDKSNSKSERRNSRAESAQ